MYLSLTIDDEQYNSLVATLQAKGYRFTTNEQMLADAVNTFARAIATQTQQAAQANSTTTAKAPPMVIVEETTNWAYIVIAFVVGAVVGFLLRIGKGNTSSSSGGGGSVDFV